VILQPAVCNAGAFHVCRSTGNGAATEVPMLRDYQAAQVRQLADAVRSRSTTTAAALPARLARARRLSAAQSLRHSRRSATRWTRHQGTGRSFRQVNHP